MSSNLAYDPVQQAWCDVPSGACAGIGETPQLPTYRTIAAVLEKKTGAGLRLLGWTMARTLLIAPFMRLVGVPWGKAFAGAGLASCAISTLALIRVANAEYAINQDFLAGQRWLRPRTATRRLVA